ncbi:unnamed protein product [Malus baccata var. baccata]
MQSNGDDSSAEAEYKPQPGGPNNAGIFGGLLGLGGGFILGPVILERGIPPQVDGPRTSVQQHRYCPQFGNYHLLHQSGGVGIADMIEKIENKECMEFENICTYDA